MWISSMKGMRAAAQGLALAALLTTPALAQDADHPQNEKLKIACDLGFAPFCFKKTSGEITGFTYDFADAIAKKLGRPGIDVTDSNFSAIFAGLFSKRYEMIPAPTNITTERAAQMLFSEPYMPTGMGFLVKKGGKIANLEDLKGKELTVNNGSISDKWLTDNRGQVRLFNPALQQECGCRAGSYDRPRIRECRGCSCLALCLDPGAQYRRCLSFSTAAGTSASPSARKILHSAQRSRKLSSA